MSVIPTRSNYGNGTVQSSDGVDPNFIGISSDGLYHQYIDGRWVRCAVQDRGTIAKALAFGLHSSLSSAPASPVDEQPTTTNVHSSMYYEPSSSYSNSSASYDAGEYITNTTAAETSQNDGRFYQQRGGHYEGSSGSAEPNSDNGYYDRHDHHNYATQTYVQDESFNAAATPVYDNHGYIVADSVLETAPPSEDYRAAIARYSNQFHESVASRQLGHGAERSTPLHSQPVQNHSIAHEPTYHNGIEHASVAQAHPVDYAYSPQHHFVAEHRPSAQYPPTHQHLMEHLPASSPYTTFPTPAASLATNNSSPTNSPPASGMSAHIDSPETSALDIKEAEWRWAAELAKQNPPWSSSSPTPSSRLSIQKLNAIKKSPEKKQTLACLFCRERKIACGRPSLDNPDQTCNQCARRNLCCEYPKESRRGQHKRIPRRMPPLDLRG